MSSTAIEIGRGALARAEPRPRPHPAAPAGSALLRHALVFIAVAPIGALIAARVAHTLEDSLLTAYGALLLTVTSSAIYIAFRHYTDPSEDCRVAAGAPLVSCLVAARNEEGLVGACVRSILRSTYANLELIVVDDGSTDGTRRRLEELQNGHPFTLVSLLESVGKKRALTVAAQQARGELLVFTDSDSVLAEDAVERVVRAFAAHPEIGAVSGHARALNGDRNFLTRMQDAWYEGQFSVWKAAESVFGAVTCTSGPLAAYRREAIYNLLPAWADDRFAGREFRFATDRQLTGYVLGSEEVGTRLKLRYLDSPFVWRTRYPEKRWRVEYVKSARVWTVVPPSAGRFLRQQVRWKKSFIRNLFFTGAFYWRKGPVPAFLFYTHALIVLVAPFMAFRHLVFLPLSGRAGLAVLYLSAIFVKGSIWALAYKAECPGCRRWVYRPFMSLVTLVLSSLLLLYAAATLRRQAWARG